MKLLLKIIIACADAGLAIFLTYHLLFKPVWKVICSISGGYFSFDLVLLVILKFVILFAFVGVNGYIIEKWNFG